MDSFTNDSLDIRDVEFLVPMPDRQPFQLTQVKIWIGEVFKKILSRGFKAFSKEELSLSAAKIFCSENLLKNIIMLNARWSFTPSIIQQLDQYIHDSVLPYRKMRYPIADESANQSLSELLKQVDLTNLAGSNYIQTSEIKWQYRQSGIYNDLIMQTLNHVIKKIDKPSEFTFDNKGSNYEDFKSMMNSIFERVQDFDYMVLRHGKIDEIIKLVYKGILQLAGVPEEERREVQQKETVNNEPWRENNMYDLFEKKDSYAAKVREYTSYSVSRKVPEGTQLYTDKEIQSMNITFKSPSILRIIQKWCKELIYKFQTPNYFEGQMDNSYDRTSDLTSFLREDRIMLDRLMEQEKEEIANFKEMNNINNYSTQALLLNRDKDNYDPWGHEFIGELQWKTGNFSIDLIKHFHNYLIAYINRLIHGILKVSKQFYEQNQKKSQNKEIQWSSPPKLLTFSIADLMRCQFTSRQKQIIEVIKNFQDLNNVHSDNRISFLQVRNRLSLETHDLALIFKFNNDIICQVQLTIQKAVGEKQSNKQSNQFSHYIYELQRSAFGPLVEICNIWASNDNRFSVFQNIRKKMVTSYQISEQFEECFTRHTLIYKVGPFICSICKEVYSHNYFIKQHKQCQNCGRFYCAKCTIDYERWKNPQNLLDTFVLDPQIKVSCKTIFTVAKYRQKKCKLPSEGVCIEVQSRIPRLQTFQVFTYQSSKYLLGKRNDKIYEIEKINTKEESQSFLTRYLVFEGHLPESYSLNDQEAKRIYILPEIQCKNFKKYDFKISISENLQDDHLISHFSKIETIHLKSVRQLLLDSNRIQNIGKTIVDFFPKVEFLDLNNNPIVSYQNLENLTYLKHLQLSHCALQKIPLNLYELKLLQRLKVSYNQIKLLHPQIQNLKKLKILEINHNEIQQLPQELQFCKELTILKCQHNCFKDCFSDAKTLNFSSFVNLKEIYIGQNEISIFPPGICQLKNLKILKINNNLLKFVDPHIGQLSNLVEFSLQNNNLTQMTSKFAPLLNLKKLNLGKNSKLSQIPQDLSKCISLQERYIPNCNLQAIPDQTKINSLKILNISQNKIKHLECFLGNIRRIEHLNLSKNSFSPQFISQLNKVLIDMKRLRTIDLSQCKCTSIPKFSVCQQMQIIRIRNNQITKIGKELQGMNHLTQFDASLNKIASIDESFIKLQSLIDLDLHFNHIQSLPVVGEDYKKWPRLQRLDLSNNYLERLPNVVTECSKLVKLNLRGNKISNLPKTFLELKNLKQLDISDNSFKYDEQQDLRNSVDRVYGGRHINSFTYIQQHLTSLKIIGASSLHIISEEGEQTSRRQYKDQFLTTPSMKIIKKQHRY